MSAMPDSKAFSWRLWLFLAIGAILVIALAAPVFIKRKGGCDQTEQVSNARQIGLALFEFETEYGTYPSEATAAEVTKNHPDHGLDLSGTSSNALFRQLFAARITQSEQMFYAKAHGATKPDGVITPGHLLERGEVGFGCISGISTEGNPAGVVAFAPIIPGTTKFDPKPFDGVAVFLRVDNSVLSIRINRDGHAIYHGHDILSPTHPIWEGRIPTIHYPELDPPPSFFQRLFR